VFVGLCSGEHSEQVANFHAWSGAISCHDSLNLRKEVALPINKVYAQLGHEYGADQPWDEMYCCNNRKLMIKRNKIAYFVAYPLNQLREVSNYGSL